MFPTSMDVAAAGNLRHVKGVQTLATNPAMAVAMLANSTNRGLNFSRPANTLSSLVHPLMI